MRVGRLAEMSHVSLPVLASPLRPACRFLTRVGPLRHWSMHLLSVILTLPMKPAGAG